MGPEDLEKALSRLTPHTDSNILYGFNKGDDTGVYRLRDDLALVQSVDFFTPIVDDPYTFGRIAAANALSDLYTMAARPITALNIIAFPCELGIEHAAEILRGGGETVSEAGAALLGGHSVEDKEPKYGLAVTGLVHPDRMITNQGARPGDALILTKKIGVGILIGVAKLRSGALGSLAVRGPAIPGALYEEAITAMMRLNKDAADAMIEFGVNACTDVTGFGLLGHARNIGMGSRVALSIGYSRTPRYPMIEAYAIPGTKGGGEKNYHWVKPRLTVTESITHEKVMVLCDPQTSGGLLMAVAEENAEALVQRLRGNGDEAAAIIGHVEDGTPGAITVTP